jgi:hypothetical protein
MALERLPRYTIAELESRAKLYLAKHFGPETPIPVDIDWLVQAIERIELDEWPALRANHHIEGAVMRDADSGQLWIYIAEELMSDTSPTGMARCRMTVAEELAHVHLHREIIESIETPDDFRQLHNHPQWGEVERDAKRYAAALLIPAKRLMPEARESYRALVRTAGTANKDAIKKWICSTLKDRFQVSNIAMHHRLSEYPARVYKHVDEALDDGLDELP